ncbi:hypothetical protein M413DRAFT_439782 [Hebeloma cylindrosporum]|uniref:Uncharacterized protein n=1 Tax=Hebeloma cylindrosporum TaxID=76867 RepID=A0A0C3CVB1_HEBCY|nr:hypothetical protein M413DRAFT_439782 [Hebeloma cylindrosporum h7]
MAPLPSRKSLEAMKRVDLQRICKDYGVKANLKSEALIDLLLDTQSTPAHQSIQPTRRSVSTRQSSRAGPSRVSSMVVHDISDDDAEEISPEISEDVRLLEPSAKPVPPPVLPPARTRKAKELQTRLGVGKPIMAGGQGPRAVTRSSGSTRGKRAKSSKSLKPTEHTIAEEPEPLSVPLKEPEGTDIIEPPPHSSSSTDLRMGDVKKIVEDAVLPLQNQIHVLKSELNGVQAIKSDIAELQVQVADVCKAQKDLKVEFESLRELSLIVVSLKEEIRQLREGFGANHSQSRPSTPKAKSGQPKHGLMGFGLPSAFKNIATMESNAGSNSILPHPGIAESTLGKRHRESTGSNITGIVEEGREDEYSDSELAKKVVRPTKKRLRTNPDNAQEGSSNRITSMQDDEQAESSNSRAVPTFTVFRGSEEPSDYIDPPPPTDHLPEFFHPESPSSSNSNVQRSRSAAGVPTSSANAAENQPQGFNFAFLPISSTPNNGHYMPTFPYPEPPQSPSPAGPSSALYLSRQDERTDIFKSFGLPSPVRATRNYGALTQEDRGGFVNPAALTQGSSGKQREVSTSDTDVTDPPPSKRTMYGTELEGDTRFGDFGLEGMATNYWASGKF